jgi:hypothetical protein
MHSWHLHVVCGVSTLPSSGGETKTSYPDRYRIPDANSSSHRRLTFHIHTYVRQTRPHCHLTINEPKLVDPNSSTQTRRSNVANPISSLHPRHSNLATPNLATPNLATPNLATPSSLTRPHHSNLANLISPSRPHQSNLGVVQPQTPRVSTLTTARSTTKLSIHAPTMYDGLMLLTAASQ